MSDIMFYEVFGISIAHATNYTATGTPATLTQILSTASDILVTNLPTIFTFSLAVAATFMVYRWIRGHMRGR